MITKDTAEWLTRYVQKYPIEKVSRCAKCLGLPRFEVGSDGYYGTGRFVCENGCGIEQQMEAISEDSEELIRKGRTQWNEQQRRTLSDLAHLATKKNEVAA